LQKRLAGSLAVIMLVPSLAVAQGMGNMAHGNPTHEFGVDLGVFYAKPSGGTGAFVIAAPIGDIRIGFLSASNMNLEARFTLGFQSGGGTFINLDPGLNALFKMSGATNMHGMYFTVGADANIISNKPSGGTSVSGVIPTINAGIGTRSPWGTISKRGELFVAYSMKSTKLGRPNTISVGARLGLSFFH
jgi:hypothetical protein